MYRFIATTSGKVLRHLPLVFVPVALLLFYQQASSHWAKTLSTPEILLTGRFVFRDGPPLLLEFAAHHWVALLIFWIGANVAITAISIFGFANILQALTARHVDLAVNVQGVRPLLVCKCLAYQALIAGCYGAAVLPLYAFGWCIFQATQSDFSSLALAPAVVGFPLYFGAAAMMMLIAVVAADHRQELNLFAQALRPAAIWKLYVFYAVRLGAEVGLALLAYNLFRLTGSSEAGLVAASSVALLLPFAAFRVSGALFKLNLLKTDPGVAKLLRTIQRQWGQPTKPARKSKGGVRANP